MASSYQKVVCNRNEIYYSTVHDIYSDAGITDLMGGNLGVFSEGPGHGCTFLLDLPIYSPPLAAINPMGLLAVRKSFVVESTHGKKKSSELNIGSDIVQIAHLHNG